MTVQGNIAYIIKFIDNEFVILKNIETYPRYFHIARLKKTNASIELNDNLFEL